MALSPDGCVARRSKMLTYKKYAQLLDIPRLAIERNSSFLKGFL